MGWVRKEPWVGTAADCGGDVQDSESFTARFVNQLVDPDHWAVVTLMYYLARDEDTGRRWLEVQGEYIVCRDPERPGDTEVNSDARYYEWPLADPYTAAEEAGVPTDDEWYDVYPDWGLAH